MIGTCSGKTDKYGHENIQHGTKSFPAAIYIDELVNESFPWHWHNEIELNIAVDDPVIYHIGSKELLLEKDEVIYIKPGILHSFLPADKTMHQHSLIFHPDLIGGSHESVFYEKYINPLLRSTSPDFMIFHKNIPWQAAVIHSVFAAWDVMKEAPEGYEFTLRNLLSDVIFHISGHSATDTFPTSAKEVRNYERIKLLLDHIHKNYMDTITMKSLSTAAGISESECLRCFHSMMRTTPIQYLNSYRLAKAASLLKSSDSTITEISMRCGFNDISYFTRIFKKAYDCTPKTYRKKGTQQINAARPEI